MVSNQFFAGIIGHEAEQKAKDHLQQEGLVFIAQNFSAKVGEIDLIMQDNEQIVFVEVKYRKNTNFGTAAEQFTRAKRAKLVKAIMWYFLEQNININDVSMRIDLVAIDDQGLEWIKNV